MEQDCHHWEVTPDEQRAHMRRVECILEGQRKQLRNAVRALNRIAAVLTPAPESQIESVVIRVGKPVTETAV